MSSLKSVANLGIHYGEEKMTIVQTIKEKIEKEKRHNIRLMLVGRTGQGKSSTINSLFHNEVASVGDYEATTLTVDTYETIMEEIPITVYDTPGLCDDLEDVGNDEAYLTKIRETITDIDSMLFVSRLDDTRVSSDERRGIRLITQALGKDIWKYAVIVFTFAGNVSPERYQEALTKRTALLQKEIAKHASDAIARQIPSVAVENAHTTTPDGKEWLGELFTKVFTRISNNAVVAFLFAMEDNLRPDENGNAKITFTEKQKVEIRKKIDATIIPTLAATGAAIGSIFGPVGTAVGGAVGAIVGAVAWFW